MDETYSADVVEVVQSFINAGTFEECQQIAAQRRDELFTAEADQLFAHFLEQYADDKSVSEVIWFRWNLMRQFRRQAILSELAGLTASADLTRRIEVWHVALAVTDRRMEPQAWADLHVKLAEQYSQGEAIPPNHVEQAIQHLRQALEVYSRRQFPIGWAMIHNQLGLMCEKRASGKRDANVERAIKHYQLAACVLTREADQARWAQIQSNLGNAYRARLRGERSANMERAIEHHQLALDATRREDHPTEWAQMHDNLAIAYFERIAGERADNMEQAIAHYRQALTVYHRRSFPEQWATTHNNLANAYAERLDGPRVHNLERALAHNQLALAVRTPETDREGWARTQVNLGNIYRLRLARERVENLEQAIQCYTLALQVYVRGAFDVQWAQIQSNLGLVCVERLRGDRTENLVCAIKHCHAALRIYTRETFPTDWARVHNTLGMVYEGRVSQGRPTSLAKAAAHYRRALEVYTPQAFPVDCLWVSRNVGDLFFNERDWSKALEAYEQALQAGDQLFSSAYTEPGRRSEVGETTRLYVRTAFCMLQLGQRNQAFRRLEQGKTRLLAQALAMGNADLQRLPDHWRNAMIQARAAVRALDAEMRLPAATPARRSNADLGDALRRARSNLDQLVRSIRTEHPDFMPVGLELQDILALVPVGGALVAPLITSQGSSVFIIPAQATDIQEQHVIPLERFNEQALNELLVGRELEPGWLRADATSSETRWQEMILNVTRKLWELVIERIHRRLVSQGIHRIVLLPSGGLQVLPLHAAWRQVDGAKRYLMDEFEISYAPSTFALSTCQSRLSRPENLAAVVAGVSEYRKLVPLRFTHLEVESIGRLFDARPLLDDAVTAEMIRQQANEAGYLHLSCHGSFAWGRDPLDSALYLAGDRALTLAEILSRLELGSMRLVTLSACETGIIEVNQSPDEYVGLPAGFMQAGATGIVSSLWSVNALSTALLMIKFYEYHLRGDTEAKKGALPPAAALRKAQLCLRDVTNAELAELFDQYRRSGASSQMTAIAQEQFADYVRRDPDERPFAHPYYWAAFAFYGV